MDGPRRTTTRYGVTDHGVDVNVRRLTELCQWLRINRERRLAQLRERRVGIEREESLQRLRLNNINNTSTLKIVITAYKASPWDDALRTKQALALGFNTIKSDQMRRSDVAHIDNANEALEGQRT